MQEADESHVLGRHWHQFIEERIKLSPGREESSDRGCDCCVGSS